MANSYRASATWVGVPKEKIKLAEQAVESARAKIAEDLASQGLDTESSLEVEVIDTDSESGVWIGEEEYFDPDQAEILIREVVELLELEGLFSCSWATYCSKLRAGEFGGGAFALSRGVDTVWIEPEQEARIQLKAGNDKQGA